MPGSHRFCSCYKNNRSETVQNIVVFLYTHFSRMSIDSRRHARHPKEKGHHPNSILCGESILNRTRTPSIRHYTQKRLLAIAFVLYSLFTVQLSFGKITVSQETDTQGNMADCELNIECNRSNGFLKVQCISFGVKAQQCRILQCVQGVQNTAITIATADDQHTHTHTNNEIEEIRTKQNKQLRTSTTMARQHTCSS